LKEIIDKDISKAILLLEATSFLDQDLCDKSEIEEILVREVALSDSTHIEKLLMHSIKLE